MDHQIPYKIASFFELGRGMVEPVELKKDPGWRKHPIAWDESFETQIKPRFKTRTARMYRHFPICWNMVTC